MAEKLPIPRALPALMSLQEKMNYLNKTKFPFNGAFEKYDKMKKIGQGTFGEVWKAKNKETREIVAMKKILTENESQGFPITALREIKILKHVKNENIVRLKEVITKQSGNKRCFQSIHYLVFEFCEYDLAGLLSAERLSFHLAEIKTLIKQLLLGLHYLHHNNMLHRDMKSSNVLINKEGILKLADFGLSRPISAKQVKALTNRVVTLWYRPPELLLGERLYTAKIDMWGAGCIMAEMWTRYPILQGHTEQKQLSLITRLCGSINPDTWPDVEKLELFGKIDLEQGVSRKIVNQMRPLIKDAMACDLLDKLLTLDPKKRYDSDKALDHDFFFSDPMPAEKYELKNTLAKIGTDHFEYFTSRRVNVGQQQQKPVQIMQQQQMQQSHLQKQQMQRSQFQQQQQQQRAKQTAETSYYDRIY